MASEEMSVTAVPQDSVEDQAPVKSWGFAPTFLSLLILLVAACVLRALFILPRHDTREPRAAAEPTINSDSGVLHEVLIRRPQGPPTVQTGMMDVHGRPVTVACATCHTTKQPNVELRLGMELKSFHQSLKGQHGNLTCTSCHHPGEGYASLRLADGQSVAYRDVMQLCAQCHGPQYRDYTHGAHGGMAGYWDLKQGPRQRNNCIDCHDPHHPKFPTVRPVPGPRDRFLHPRDERKGAGHE